MQRKTLNNLLLILAVILLTLGVISQLFMGGKEEPASGRATGMQEQQAPKGR